MFTRILVPLDRSALAEQALGLAAFIARPAGAGIDVTMVHEPLETGLESALEPLLEAEHKYLESVVSEVELGKIKASHALLRGDPAEMICARAMDVDADLIVMTSHGRTGLSRAWLGSVADAVVRHSTLPVLVRRPRSGDHSWKSERPVINRILVPLDSAALATDILPTAVSLAQCSKARLLLLQVVQPVPLAAYDATSPYVVSLAVPDEPATQCLLEEADRHLAGLARQLLAQGVAGVDTHVMRAAHVAQSIVAFAANHHADVIAMSTHGRGASRLVIGSVVDKVRRGCDLPMLLRRPVAVSEDRALLSDKSVEGQLPALARA